MSQIRENSPSVQRPQLMLPGLVDQINQRLGSIQDRQSVVRGALDRLINPRPTGLPTGDVEKTERDPGSHEGQLQAIIRRLDNVLQSESDQADTLNDAV